jgi:hypothetical protein
LPQGGTNHGVRADNTAIRKQFTAVIELDDAVA